MRVVLVAAFTAVFCAAGAAPKASFDCSKATTPVEKLICSDDGLATLDVQMAGVFTGLVAAHAGEAAGIRDGQRVWMNERSQCLTDKKRAVSCLSQHYRERMAVLQGSTLLVCGKVESKGTAFSLSCTALNNPLQLSFVLSGRKGDTGDAELTKLTVTKAGKAQAFTLEGQIFFDGLSSALELTDVNFDGFDDIKLATATSAGPNMGYDYWLYVPKTGQFTATKLGEQLSGFDIVPDAKTKTITVNGRSSCCAWNSSTYGWSGSTLRLRTSTDSGSFSAADLPGMDAPSLCGSEAKHFNEAGLITRIDVALGGNEEFACERDQVAAQAGLSDQIKHKPKGYSVQAKDKAHFAIIFDKPVKPAY